MPRPGARQHKAWAGFEGPQESHTLPTSEREPGGGYGHQTKLSGKKKGREFSHLSQNYMNPPEPWDLSFKREDSVWAELGRRGQVSVLWQDASVPGTLGLGISAK